MRYFAEFNRPRGDSIRITERGLRRSGLQANQIAHKTSLVIERPSAMSWRTFKNAIRAELQPRRGSVVIFSERTGNTFLCSNRGNQPGRFQRL